LFDVFNGSRPDRIKDAVQLRHQRQKVNYVVGGSDEYDKGYIESINRLLMFQILVVSDEDVETLFGKPQQFAILFAGQPASGTV